MIIINISGEIGWDVMPEDIKKQLNDAKGKDIEVHITSPGGFVFDGIEIFNAFRDYKKQYPKAQMMLTIKGLAASMASYLAVNPAFDLITAEDNAVFMIHNAWGGAVGDYREMKKSAEVLEGVSDLLGQAYAKKTGKKKEEIKKAMDDESWYFGNEILESGFVDEIIKSPEKKEKESALSESKIAMSLLGEKLVKNKTDFAKLAAVLRHEEETANNKEVVTLEFKSEQLDLINKKMSEIKDIVENSTTPAASSAGENNNNIGGVVMTLDELKSQHPALYNEIFKAGYDSGKAEAMAVASKAATFAANKEYPEQIHAVALEVMQGKKSMETLDVLVANADMIKEMLKSKSAQEEQPEGGNGQQEPAADDEAKFKAEVARSRAALGLEVN